MCEKSIIDMTEKRSEQGILKTTDFISNQEGLHCSRYIETLNYCWPLFSPNNLLNLFFAQVIRSHGSRSKDARGYTVKTFPPTPAFQTPVFFLWGGRFDLLLVSPSRNSLCTSRPTVLPSKSLGTSLESRTFQILGCTKIWIACIL